ncbi:MAG: cupin domain-containing protein [Treponema sp.]|jgi:mannose-6-phosphate isomerase-like protein (cupin superfamily)|nr:cupin domain-containing protein [Treponema sp.]
MIYHRNEMKTEQKEKMRGGEGSAFFTHFVDGSTMQHARLLAELTLPPGASIGCHQHDRETEYFIFLSGSGMVNDNGVEMPVTSGDVMVTGNGASHSVANTGQVPLVFHAIIITQ